MFENNQENETRDITIRLLILGLFFLCLGGVLIYHIFQLQIVNGEEYLTNFKLRIKKERSIPSTRGKIFDRNGELLAYNELAYSVIIEDVYETGRKKNIPLNETIRKVITIVIDNGDKVVNDFNIILNERNQYEFAVEDTKRLRFLADVYGKAEIDGKDGLSYKQRTATPDEVIEYLADDTYFGIGGYTDEDKEEFQVGLGYTKEELLQVLTVRYALSLNSYQKYIPTTIAKDISEKTVAMVMENYYSLEGVSVAEDTIRKYEDSYYFSHVLGYTGKISQEELTELSKLDSAYAMHDMVGKAGIEKVMEIELQGDNGSEDIYVDNLGKTIETANRTEPVAGKDLHLTIDSKLQKAVYTILEQKIAGILVSKIKNIKEYTPGPNATASSIVIPIDDVYFALFNNNIISTKYMAQENAKETEREVYQTFLVKKTSVLEQLEQELLLSQTPYKSLTAEYKQYIDYVISMLASSNRGIILTDRIDKNDPTYLAFHKEETISAKEYLLYAIAMNWVDVTKINLENKYSDSEEIYQTLIDYILLDLQNSSSFDKSLYKYMIKENTLSGRQVCLLLWEQNIVDIDAEELSSLKSGMTSPYNFILDAISKLVITPAQLALDPFAGSCIVTDTKTGEVLALVSYPSYDNNRLANTIDSEYYKELYNDLSNPMWDYATQQKTAPGSTFKMVSAAAALEEGAVTSGEGITCLGTYRVFETDPIKCWINPGAHGSLNAEAAIQHSCNYFFYESAFRLSQTPSGYSADKGVQVLAKYADMFGLSETSGVEIMESEPQVSDQYPIPSAIGQGTNNYTTAGLARYVTTVANNGTCYNLSLLDKLTDAKGNLIEDFSPEVRNKVELAPSTWSILHNGMRRMAESSSALSNLPIQTAGKTGTAQEGKRADHALFVGYAPFENPEIAMAIRIANGYNSSSATEIARDIIKYHFELTDSDELLTGNAAIPDTIGPAGD